MNLRISAATAAALALSITPAAFAKAKDPAPEGVFVCNTASQNWQGGDLSVSVDDPQGALRYSDDLRAKKSNGAGLVNAAMHSRALALCGDPEPATGGGDTGGDGWGGTGG
jgi:hypothetical protein